MADIVLQLSGKPFRWDEEKNARLIEERRISFEEIVLAIGQNGLLDVFRHPNSRRYPNQPVLVVAVRGYAYAVPFVEDDACLFLKTIVPSRKATRSYLGHGHEIEEPPDAGG